MGPPVMLGCVAQGNHELEWCEDPATPALALGIDAASVLSLGWALPSPALSAALPQPGAAPLAPKSALRDLLEASHAVQTQLQDRPAAEDGYDSDATVVPSGTVDTEPPSAVLTAQPATAMSLAESHQLPASAAVNAVSIATADGLLGMPAWLPAALTTLEATAGVCAEQSKDIRVIGRRVAFLLFGELTVDDGGAECVLSEGLHIGRCTAQQSLPPRGCGGALPVMHQLSCSLPAAQLQSCSTADALEAVSSAEPGIDPANLFLKKSMWD